MAQSTCPKFKYGAQNVLDVGSEYRIYTLLLDFVDDFFGVS